MTTPADELRTAAATLREVAPRLRAELLASLAHPVADWLDMTAADYDPEVDVQEAGIRITRHDQEP